MARHVGIAQVHIIPVNRHDSIHDMLDLRLPFPLHIAPLAVDDIFLRHFRLLLHQLHLHNILDFLYSDDIFSKMGDHSLHDSPYPFILPVHPCGLKGLADGICNLDRRKVLPLSVTLDNTDSDCTHNLFARIKNKT